MDYLKNLVEKNGHKLISSNQELLPNHQYVRPFDYSQQHGGTYDSFKYYNDYIIDLGEKSPLLSHQIQSKTYTWDELYERADGCAFGDDRLTAKDNAMNYIIGIAYDNGIDLEAAENTEEAIDDYLKKYGEILFDEDGEVFEKENLSLGDKIQSTPQKIQLDFGRILSELEMKNVKLGYLPHSSPASGNFFLKDEKENLYSIETYWMGSYLDRLIEKNATVAFEPVDWPFTRAADVVFWEFSEIKEFVETTLKIELPEVAEAVLNDYEVTMSTKKKSVSLEEQIRAASNGASVSAQSIEPQMREQEPQR